jgi:hypothetical protein
MSEAIRVTSHIARDFLQNSAYFNTVPKVVWEYVSNSVDNPKQGQTVDVEVRITKDRIMVSDNGCGMSRDGLRNFFTMHGENIRRGMGENVRGRYGTGKCAAFGIADVIRVETAQKHVLNIVELHRKDIEQSKSGEPFTIRDIIVDKFTAQEDGTRIILSHLNIRNIEVPATIAYIERHLGRQLHNHTVVINDHVCEYQEPSYTWQKVFHPNQELAKVLGNLELVVKVSPIPLDRERAGIDILSKGIWHDTKLGSIDNDIALRLFGEVDMPALEEGYDDEKIPPFDNTRNMTLNVSNPIVASLLGWIDESLHEISHDILVRERERKASDEAKRLEKHARELEKLLNDDFRNLQMELERIRRAVRLQGKGLTEAIVPGTGEMQTEFALGGPEHGDGVGGDMAGPGEQERPGSSLLPGKEKGSPSTIQEKKVKQSSFHIEYKHEEAQSPRSRYEKENRTIVINLDHPQISKAIKEGGSIESREFREITYEVALVEYAIALGYERLRHDEFYGGRDALYDIRETINRVSRSIPLT